jgi:hypothetical protein
MKEEKQRTSLVVEQHDRRLQPIPDHCRHLLHRQLEASVSNKHDHPPRDRRLLRRQKRAQRRSDAETDAAPEDLTDDGGALRQRKGEKSEGGGSDFGNDDVALLKVAPDEGPEDIVPVRVQERRKGVWKMAGEGKSEGREGVEERDELSASDLVDFDERIQKRESKKVRT